MRGRAVKDHFTFAGVRGARGVAGERGKVGGLFAAGEWWVGEVLVQLSALHQHLVQHHLPTPWWKEESAALSVLTTHPDSTSVNTEAEAEPELVALVTCSGISA